MAISPELIAAAEQLIGLRFTDAERELMRSGLDKQLENYAQLRSVALANDIPPALQFDPQSVPHATSPSHTPSTPTVDPIPPTAPDDLEQLAFAPVTQLAALLRTRQISSTALTEMYLRRLNRRRRIDSVRGLSWASVPTQIAQKLWEANPLTEKEGFEPSMED